MSSYNSKYLAVDLTSGKTEAREIPGRWLRDYLGGVGLGTRLYLECARPGADTLGPDNPVVMARGPLSGTMAPASAGHAVVTRSPATGLLCGSVSFGLWSLALAGTGYDAVVITGASASPVYLFIDDGRVHLRRADPLAGQGGPQTAAAIRRESGDSRVQVACTGPAGESLARLATIRDGHRLMHRGGAGAVLGAKKLKAVAVRGTRPVSVADIDAMRKAVLDLNTGWRQTAAGGGGLEPGECLLPGSGRCHLPARNYQQAIPGGAASLAAECAAKGRLIKTIACPACPVACQHVYRITDDPHSDEQVVLDNEALAALGPLCGMFHLPVILKALDLCHVYGLDPVSAGASVAWAMECFERGLLTSQDTNGLDLSFGSADGLVETTRRIGQLSGIGAVLAEGVLRAANGLGQGSGEWAMQVKGLEMAGCDPRTQPGLALRLAAGLRPPTLDGRDDPSATAADACREEDLAAAGDSLAICPNARRYFRDFPAEAARMYTLATGMPLNPAELRRAGERTNNLIKAIDIREGWQRPDDWLPPRLFREPLDTGEGAVVSEKDLTAAIDGYYRGRGWSAEGLVPGEKLAALGMDDLREMLKGNRHGAPPHTLR